jgi:glycerate kinase
MQEIPELSIDLMQRPEPSATGEETWMEVYRHQMGLTPQMIEQIERAAKELGLPSKRATEVFVSLR